MACDLCDDDQTVTNGVNGSLINSLCNNLDRRVTVYTGSSRCGFTGLLADVNCDTCKLVTGCSAANNNITVIPIDKITACTFCNN